MKKEIKNNTQKIVAFLLVGIVCGVWVGLLLGVVDAAYTLDGHVVPSADYAYRLGTPTARWATINQQVYLDASGNVGIGTASPAASLEVNGGVRLIAGTKGTCDATLRGVIWYTGGASKDSVEVCAKNASSVYAWRTIY